MNERCFIGTLILALLALSNIIFITEHNNLLTVRTGLLMFEMLLFGISLFLVFFRLTREEQNDYLRTILTPQEQEKLNL